MRIDPTLENVRTLNAAYADHDTDAPLRALSERVRAHRELNLSDLEVVCRWKSPRALPRVRRNTDSEVREVTRWALSTPQERMRLESLLMLHGVSWPTASVVLHWFHSDPYPILDVRALWSLGFGVPSTYTFEFWWQYVTTCRDLSGRLSLPMRDLDRALWQYSRNAGGPGTAR